MAALLNPRHEVFAQQIAKGVPISQAYVNAGYKGKGAEVSGRRLLENANVLQRVNELRGVIVSGVIKLEITERNSRVLALQDIANRLRTVMDERAADPTMQAIPGGKTGLVVRQVKATKNGNVDEYKVDTATVQCFKEILEHAAKEVGQWSEKRDVNFSWDGQLETLTPAQREKIMEQLALAAYPGDPAALEKARLAAEQVVQ